MHASRNCLHWNQSTTPKLPSREEFLAEQAVRVDQPLSGERTNTGFLRTIWQAFDLAGNLSRTQMLLPGRTHAQSARYGKNFHSRVKAPKY